MNTAYDCSARGYLRRARQLAMKGDFDSLFYAAFELRCGIEARMREYLEVADDICEKKKQGWEIPKLAKNLEKAFMAGDKTVEVTFSASNKECRLFYTPVTARLRSQGERLNDYRHAMKGPRKADDPWWRVLRTLLEATCEELALATKGTLLGPPLLHPNGKTIKTHNELEVEPLTDKMMIEIASVGKISNVSFRYLDSLPSDVK